MIKVLVGANATEFNISKHQICEESEFFKAACKEHWTSGQEGVVRLVEDDPEIFGIFVTWLLTRDIEQAEDFIEVTGTEKQRRARLYRTQFTQLATCFFLATALQAENFQNAVMDLILAAAAFVDAELQAITGTKDRDIQLIYENTISGCALSRFMLDAMVGHACLDTLSEHLPNVRADWSHTYITEMMKLAMRSARKIDVTRDSLKLPWKRDRCVYHEHRGQPKGWSCTKKIRTPRNGTTTVAIPSPQLPPFNVARRHA